MIKNNGVTGRTVPIEHGHQKAAPKMQYVRLGNSGLKVSRLIFGTATYGIKSDVAWRIEKEEAFKHLQRAWELGFNTFDTSNFYCNGVSEEILGEFLKTVPREAVVVMTKCHFPIGDSSKSGPAGLTLSSGSNRKHIFDNVKAALKRLQTDYIDVMQLHRFDYETPIEETMQALHDVVQAGYVRYIGISSCWAWQFHAMQNYAIANKLTPFINCQNFYNLLYREEEREMMPLLKYLGVNSTPWSPMAKGHLTRPLDRAYETVHSTSDAYHDEAILGVEWEKEINRRVEALAKKRNLPMANIALAWVLHKDSVAAPIVGCSKIERIEETLAALDVELSDKEIRYLEEPYQPPYFNEVAAYADESLMFQGQDPAIGHPMAPRFIHILEAYTQLYQESGKEQPLIVIASNANVGEVLATAELGCQHITILAHHMKELQETPLDATALKKYPFLVNPPAKKQNPYYANLQTPERLRVHSKSDPMAGPNWDGQLADIHADYLANGGKLLSGAMDADAAVVKKMQDVLGAFNGGDAKAKAAIEAELAKL